MEELDLKELFIMFWNKRLEIILITLVAMAVGVVYSYFFVTPKYKASTTLVLASTTGENSTDGAITQTDLTLNAKLVSTYSELIKSKAVLSQVVNSFASEELDQESLKKNISVQAVNDTEVIKITVIDLDTNIATQIANKIAEVFSEKVVEIYNISNVYILDRAEPDTKPSNVNHAKDIVIFAFVGIVISFGFALTLNMLDTTIKTEQDIEKVTGLLVLSSIPNCDIELKTKKGGRR